MRIISSIARHCQCASEVGITWRGLAYMCYSITSMEALLVCTRHGPRLGALPTFATASQALQTLPACIRSGPHLGDVKMSGCLLSNMLLRGPDFSEAFAPCLHVPQHHKCGSTASVHQKWTSFECPAGVEASAVRRLHLLPKTALRQAIFVPPGYTSLLYAYSYEDNSCPQHTALFKASLFWKSADLSV